MLHINAAHNCGPIKLGPGTAGVVQRIHIATKLGLPLKVMKPMEEQTCSINQY